MIFTLTQCYYSNNLHGKSKFLSSDLFISVSRSEARPVSISEALSVGIPVLATNAGGTCEIIDKSVGRLLPVSIKPTELAREIRSFYKLSLSQKSILRKNARLRWRQRANSDNVFKEFVQFLAEYDTI